MGHQGRDAAAFRDTTKSGRVVAKPSKKSMIAAQAAAHHAQATELARRGEPMAALQHRFAAFRAAPNERSYRQSLAAALIPLRLEQAAPAVEEALVRLLQADDVDPQALAGVLISLIKADPRFKALAAADWHDGSQSDALQSQVTDLFGWPLLQHALAHSILCDREVERLLTACRRFLLLEAGSTADDVERFAPLMLQAALTEFLWEEDPAESEILAEASGHAGATLLVCAYRELEEGALKALFRDQAGLGPFGRLLYRRLVAEPAEERRLAEAMPVLELSEDAVSRSVQAQYESNPYPRWTGVQRRAPRPLAAVVRSFCPELPESALPQAAKPQILVAGCGTGAHAVKVASRYAGSRVTAIDLSRRALAYAEMKATALKLGNIRFLQADILALEGWERSFDLIECSGVLHHLAEPLRGWGILTGLLAERGVMRIGLYSALGRRHILAMQDMARREGTTPEQQSIRRLRRRIEDEAAAGDESAAAVLREADFYSASGLRDLLLHVQEQQFSVEKLQEALADLDLEFLAFEHPFADVPQAFETRFGGRANKRDLSVWGLLEQERPDSFRGMYQFWCRKR